MYYEGQSVLLASMHGKEKAIALPFANRLSCTLAVHDFDTDQFGTFTGEVHRPLSPYETCILKAKTGAQRYEYRLSVASEGSFGPHPAIPFIPSAQEIMVFIDSQCDWIIAEQIVSTKTNYAMITVNRSTDISTFLKQVHFPTHALIVQTAGSKKVIAKGVNDIDSLNRFLSIGFQYENQLLLGTDMRAMMNPTRMEVLGELADKLAIRIATQCSQCECPGFGFKATRGALPCALCGSSTSFYQEEVWGCIECEFQEYKIRQDGLIEAEPLYCPDCNP